MAEVALYAVNALLGYLLMLAVMTYNLGCLVAIVAGLTIGHVLVAAPGADFAGVPGTHC
jgi:copper transporter 1